jgi:hypothetical protein
MANASGPAPPPARRVAPGAARLRSGEVFLYKIERRLRYAFCATGTKAQVGEIGQRRLAPDPVACRLQQPRPRAADPANAVEPPEQVDRGEDDDRAGDTEQRVSDDFDPRHPRPRVCKQTSAKGWNAE